MKTIFTILAFQFLAIFTIAQAPQAFKYQAVIRDANGAPISNGTVSFRGTIRQGSPTGSVIFQEPWTGIQTNDFGLVNINFGESFPAQFSQIDWADGPYYFETEVDPNGGTSYAISGVSKLQSVPFALYANEAAWADSTGHAQSAASADFSQQSLYSDTTSFAFNSDEANMALHAQVADSVTHENDPVFTASPAAGITAGDISGWNTHITTDGDLDASNELQTLSLSGDTLMLSQGGQVALPGDMDWSRSGNSVFNDVDQIGIGTSQPSADLDVEGSFRFVDGNEAEGRIMRSDSLGNVRWDEESMPWTFYFTGPSYSVSGTGNNVETYCSDTIFVSSPSIVIASSAGHMRASNGRIASGILFDNEQFLTGTNNLYYEKRRASYSSIPGGYWTSAGTTRIELLQPGHHIIKLVFAGLNSPASTNLNAASIEGVVIPIN